MNDPLTMGVLKRDVQIQMTASREVLEMARRLQKIIEAETDVGRKAELSSVVSDLLATGSKIVKNAREVGQQVARAAGAMP